ncbi:hypothetical protein B0H66DRAFT_71633 [Apodospora peruviana]|uniref:Uncharacterized protein n=1 Tax=Apodospora peruviana TaxID=516989 RepID=A0AAE0ISW3_9PEZI|nr:hypothetical protein B0H66DRAFT_71633 [Apodospora peruviana]
MKGRKIASIAMLVCATSLMIPIDLRSRSARVGRSALSMDFFSFCLKLLPVTAGRRDLELGPGVQSPGPDAVEISSDARASIADSHPFLNRKGERGKRPSAWWVCALVALKLPSLLSLSVSSVTCLLVVFLRPAALSRLPWLNRPSSPPFPLLV